MGNSLSEQRKNKKILQKIDDCNDVPFFSFDGHKDVCIVSKCYDGDTIHLVRIINKTPFRFNCRLLGIDTAEMKSHDVNEKIFAKQTRDYLADLVLNKMIWVEFKDFDKYGRLLCNIYLTQDDMNDQYSVNQLLIDEGFAQPYDGGTKLEYKDWPKRSEITKRVRTKTKQSKWFCGLF